MRIESRNPWSVSVEPQRSDYWVVDLKRVAFLEEIGLKNHFFYASAVGIPEKAINADVTYRDSMSYNMPGYDQPLGEIRITFIHDVNESKEGDIRRSRIYRLLETWHRLARAGRGAVSREDAVFLDENYRAPLFRFDITVRMACGFPLKSPAGDPLFFSGIGGSSNTKPAATGGSNSDQTDNPDGPALEMSSSYTLVKAWLARFRLGDLSYDSPGIHKLEGIFYAEDVIPTP
jgi:hypothetical protein